MTTKIIYEFNLPEEKEDFDIQIQATNMYLALENFAEHLRKIWKYEERDTVGIDELRETFYRILEENNVTVLT